MTPRILEVEPSAVELIDRFLLDKTRRNPHFAPLLSGLIDGDPAAILIVEFYGSSDAELSAKVDRLLDHLKPCGYQSAVIQATTRAEQSQVWEVRKAGLGLLLSERSDTKPIEFIEDAAVPVDQLANYVSDIEAIIRSEDTNFAIYAHASAGCLHIRPLINLKTVRGVGQYRRIAEAAADLVIRYGGTTTGEHGEGISRSEFNQRLFGEKLVGAFREIKRAFDPDNLMNPGKIVNPAYRMDDASVMRYSPEYEVISVNTRFDWSYDNGLNGAAEMCNGAGVCRKIGSGTMCPSYMATLDEAHSTRGRANALRQAMIGNVPEGLASHDLYEVYDLCLSCKACKSECPSSVDAARMKAEFLAAYHDAHGTSLAARAFANIHRLNWLSSFTPALANGLLNSRIGLTILKTFGLPTERPLPQLAKRRFTMQVKSRTANPQATLIVDTFTEFNHPEIGLALQKITDAMGSALNILRLPAQGCCGRPAISKGFLDQAKHMANRNVRWLGEHLDLAPFIFLEPSCLSAFIDDYHTLVDQSNRAIALQVAEQCFSAEAWLNLQLDAHQPDLNWGMQPRNILLHGHCHQKSLWGTADSLNLLRRIPNATVKEIDSGCCGVAGSFGYEHYALSLKIANQRLLPAIQNSPDAIIAAPGTSCRTQITENGYTALHTVQIVANSLKER